MIMHPNSTPNSIPKIFHAGLGSLDLAVSLAGVDLSPFSLVSTAAPHLLQNLEFAPSLLPHLSQKGMKTASP